MVKKLLILIFAGATCVLAETATIASPPTEGLILWLDAADKESFTHNANGKITKWKDKSGLAHHAQVGSKSAPTRLENALHGKPALRFSGKEWLNIPVLTEGQSSYSIFIVYQRGPDQVSNKGWQRLISSTNNQHPNDTQSPAFHLSSGDRSELAEPQVKYDLFSTAITAPMTLGAKNDHKGAALSGDIAEVLIYDRSFIVYEPIEAVLKYLHAHWEIEPNAGGNWSHKGPLPTPLPKRITSDHPLSDQENKGGWIRFEALSDEFNGTELDREKWWDHNPDWYGRIPGRFLARNVSVSNGLMGITMQKDPSLKEEIFYRNNSTYKDYASGSVVGKTNINYGYFEVRAKAMNSAGSSAWWFTGSSVNLKTKKRSRLEIDVFELGGGAEGKEFKYNMNLHVFKSREQKQHLSEGAVWEASTKFSDDFHIFGLEWTPEFIHYFVDGVMIRKVVNTHWHGPMKMLFDSETMFSWLGIPKDSDLPSTFEVDYVRTWKNTETENDWAKTYKVQKEQRPSRITKYVRSMDPLPVKAQAKP